MGYLAQAVFSLRKGDVELRQFHCDSGLDDEQIQVGQIREERIWEPRRGQEPVILEVAVNIGIGEKVK